MKFLRKQNLPFKGHSAVYSSNKGNFIELVELMIKYGPVLGKHYLKEVNDYRPYDKFIHILGNRAEENIMDRI